MATDEGNSPKIQALRFPTSALQDTNAHPAGGQAVCQERARDPKRGFSNERDQEREGELNCRLAAATEVRGSSISDT